MKHWNKPFTILILALAACLVLGIGAFAAEEEPAVKTFNDIAGTEYESDITVMYTMGLTVGYTDGSYRPSRAYCRLEVAQLTQGLLGLDAPEGYVLPFTDTVDAVGREAIAAAVAGGYMSGRSDTSFDPYGSVLKAEFMSVLTKIAETLGTEDLLSKLDEELALWAEDFSVITAGQAMHAARAMIGALEAKADETEPTASEEPSDEMPAEETAEEIPAEEAAEEITAEEAEETLTEETPADETSVDDTTAVETAAPAEEAVEGEVPEAPAASGEPSEEPSEEMSAEEEPAEEAEAQPEAPAAPQGVLSPTATTPTPAPVEVPAAPAQPVTPAQPQATQTPAIDPDDPGAEMKTTVYAFYANIRDQLVSFFNDLLG